MVYRKTVMTLTVEQEASVKKLIIQKYKNLGSITQHEITVLILFITLVLLWLMRAPEFIYGWGDLFSSV